MNPRGRGLFHWAAESGSYVARSRPGVADKAVRLQDGKRFFDAVGDPLLAHDGTAMMAGTSYGTQTRRVALLRQRPGNQWETLARPDVVHDVWSTGARGDRMGIAYTNPRGLQVVLAKVK